MRVTELLLILFFLHTVPALGQSWVEAIGAGKMVIGANRDTVSRVIEMTAHMDSLLRFVPLSGQTSEVPLTVIVADSKTYSRFNSTHGRLSIFVATTDRNYILMGPRAQDSEILHEYAHYWTRKHIGAAAPWFDEGVSVAFSTLRANGDTLELSGVSRYDSSFRSCQEEISIEQVLQETSLEGYDSGKLRAFYCMAGRFISLLFTQVGVERTLSSLAPISRASISISGVSQRLAMSPAELRSLFGAFSGRRIVVGKLPGERPIAQEIKSISSSFTDAIVAELSVRMQGDASPGMDHYRRILESEPDDPGALEGLGVGYTVAGDYENAVAAFERVAALGGLSNTSASYGRFACRHLSGCNFTRLMMDSKSANLDFTKMRVAGHDGAEPDEDPDESPVLSEVSSQWSCLTNCPKKAPR